MKLIDANEVLKIVDYYTTVHGATIGRHAGIADIIYDEIAKLTAVDAEPVKHGKWIWDENAHDWNLGAFICSECKCKNDNLPADDRYNPYMFAGSSYCPNCGARMDGGEKQ